MRRAAFPSDCRRQWMLEIGAVFMRTETELILKSRRVVPRKTPRTRVHVQVSELAGGSAGSLPSVIRLAASTKSNYAEEATLWGLGNRAKDGGPDRDRTGDLMNAIHARSQLRYWPTYREEPNKQW